MNSWKFTSAPQSWLAAAALSVAAVKGQAQLVTLTDNNSTAGIFTASQAGMFNWTVDGVNQLAQQWFWYRVGSTDTEHSIDTISAPTISQPDARTATTSFSNGGIGVSVTYVLTGGAAASGASSIAETILLHNSSEVPSDFHFFQYSDFDLAGTTGGDTVTLSKDGAGLFIKASQTDVSSLLSESVVSPGADHGEVGFFPVTLNKLNDGNPTTLDDSVGPLGPGDLTWALEWDLTIPAGGTVEIDKVKSLGVPGAGTLDAPEASTGMAVVAVLGAGLAGWARRRARAGRAAA